MSLPQGAEVYSLGGSTVFGKGITWTEEELDSALSESIIDIVFDNEGTSDITEVLAGVSETDFDSEAIERILQTGRNPEDWRVGEAIGEAYLTEHEECTFPWPDSRDERKDGSSLPGADLVGFIQIDAENRFVFGEVKTSAEKTYPPKAMYGRTGLKQQLEDLRDNESIRNSLVKYLCHRAVNASWKNQYIEAFKYYSHSSTDVRIFGVMVRDVSPNIEDIRVRVSRLSKNCPADMKIKMLAIYIPNDRIATLSKDVVRIREGWNE